jgi:hypothetical protein
MLAGCGESGGVTSASSSADSNKDENKVVVVSPEVSTGEVITTTPRNLYGISDEMGTPPALPGS